MKTAPADLGALVLVVAGQHLHLKELVGGVHAGWGVACCEVLVKEVAVLVLLGPPVALALDQAGTEQGFWHHPS